MNNVTITLEKYEEMSSKIARYNALHNITKSEIRKGNRYPVKDDVVLSLLGLSEYKSEMERKAAEAVSNE